jgi:hypothetical protein
VRLPRLLALVAVLAAGSACSSDPAGTEAPRVATLSSAGSTPVASASASPERPRLRLDTTPEEEEAMQARYRRCLDDNGAPKKSDRRPTKAELDKAEAAGRTCEPYLPLPPWEKDPANPEAKDFIRDVVKCLKGKGIRYVEASELDGEPTVALGGKNNDRESIDKGLDLIPVCEREVAARNG